MGVTQNILCLKVVRRVDGTEKKAKYENGVSGARLFKNNRLSHAHLREKG